MLSQHAFEWIWFLFFASSFCWRGISVIIDGHRKLIENDKADGFLVNCVGFVTLLLEGKL
jgi:hypothetical protein